MSNEITPRPVRSPVEIGTITNPGVAVTFGSVTKIFDGVLVAVAVGVNVSVAVALGVSVGVSVAVAVGVNVSVAVAVGVNVSVAVAVGVNVSVAVAVGVGVSVAVAVGVSVGVGVAVEHWPVFPALTMVLISVEVRTRLYTPSSSIVPKKAFCTLASPRVPIAMLVVKVKTALSVTGAVATPST